MTRTRLTLVVLGLAVSIVFTYLAVRDVDFAVTWDALQESNYWWTIPSLAVLAGAVFLRALRWCLLFTPETRPSVRRATSALLIGYLFNNILPARAGEAARIVALHQRAGTSRFEALATAVTERAWDILALLALLFVSAPFLPEVTWLRRAALFAVVLTVVVLAAIVALRRFGDRPLRIMLRPLARLPQISVGRTERAAANLVQGLVAMRSARTALVAFAVTVASWLVLALSFWLLMLGFDLELGFGAALLVVIATNLAMVIPSSPAAVGVFEAATLVALGAFGVGDSEALSYAVVLHVLNFLPFIVVGYAVLHRHASAVRTRPAAADPLPATPAARSRTSASSR